jgi:hypothetical protein
MQTDSLLNQPRAREVDLASLRSGTWTRQAPIKARRPPFDRLTIGLHWGTVRLVLVLFASAWVDTAEPLHTDSAPNSSVVWCNHLGRHGASPGLAGDQGEPAALPQTNKQAASRYGQIDRIRALRAASRRAREGLAHHAVWWASIRSIFMAVSGTHAPGFDATSRVSFFS